MNLVIDRSNLLKSLNHVQSVVERRNTIPILSNVRIDASLDNLRLSATDMDIEVVEKSEDFRINTKTDNQLNFALKLFNG